MTVQTNVTLYLLGRSADLAAARSHVVVLMPKQSDEFTSSAFAC